MPVLMLRKKDREVTAMISETDMVRLLERGLIFMLVLGYLAVADEYFVFCYFGDFFVVGGDDQGGAVFFV